MFKKVMFLIIFLLCMVLACDSSADLIARYEFTADGSDTSGYGATAANGALVGSATVVADTERGQVLNLSGGYIAIPDTDDRFMMASPWPDAPDPSHDSMTVGLWIKVSNPYAEWQGIFNKGTYSFQMQLWGSPGVGADAAIGNGWTRGATDIKDGQWHHIAAVYDGSMQELRIYADGQLDTVIAGAAPNGWFNQNAGHDVIIGDNLEAPRPFTGLMDDIQFYNDAQTLEQIQTWSGVSSIQLNSPILNYEFETKIGGRTADSSRVGPAADGILMGDADHIYDAGGNGKSASNVLSLDGNGDYVICKNTEKMFFAGSFTIVTWVKMAPTDEWRAIAGRGYPGWVLQEYGDGYTAPDFVIVTDYIRGSKSISDGQWHHIAAVHSFADSKISIYIDGQFSGESSHIGVVPVTAEPITIGEYLPNTPRQLNGFLDNIRIYTEALDMQEISMDMYEQ